MSTNLPNLKQIRGGHRKNARKFVNLIWNDHSKTQSFMHGSLYRARQRAKDTNNIQVETTFWQGGSRDDWFQRRISR